MQGHIFYAALAELQTGIQQSKNNTAKFLYYSTKFSEHMEQKKIGLPSLVLGCNPQTPVGISRRWTGGRGNLG